MQVYAYSELTNEYIGIAKAYPSPLEPGKYLLPAYSTSVEPPAHREGFIRTFNGIGWDLVEIIPPEPEVPKEPTQEEILKTMQDAIQQHMDTKAKERGYDGILSLCTYATSTNPKFQAEGQAGVAWRDAVWAKAYDVMAAVRAGDRAVPAVDELLAELPAFHWPDEVEP